MKAALFMSEGRTQVVLTPETDLESFALSKIEKGESKTKVRRGSFYACQGGWTRQGADENSLILVVDEEVVKHDL
ncbi:hypothetical protein [Pseudovibrio sp. POLY-S9]|uniref:hypothetical protein n=1 Tax=Pseudovibrio sp. POLY-S9 TaxID=1576596 RepID=UPI00070ECA06|nr:hypothetical protein [Pseudovibrio sp. POLY-S9]